MIQVDINGSRRTVAPRSVEELRSFVVGPVPQDHGICVLRVNGAEFLAERWGELDLANVRDVELRSAPLAEIARAAVRETRDWVTRICAALESVSADYRMGREQHANGRLAEVADALHVLVHLLHGIRSNISLAASERAAIESRWLAAEGELSAAIDAMASDLEWRDPIALSDRTGYTLPRILRTFEALLQEIDG
jgi:hypothetical protein